MKNKIFSSFLFLLLALLMLFTKETNASCGTGLKKMTFFCFTTDDCSTSLMAVHVSVHFWTDDSTEDFYLTSDANGQITHCFTLGKNYTSKGVGCTDCNPDYGCCPSTFSPTNQPECNALLYMCSADLGGSNCYCDGGFTCPGSNKPNSSSIPMRYVLYQNYPNPFNPVTQIKYDLPLDGYVKLKIYDIEGKEVVTLIDGVINAGRHSIDFDASNLASGVYLFKIETKAYTKMRKMVLIK